MEKISIITVIIPVYNVAQYLKEALDSAINQTYKNLEIIIVDDGSDDGSEIICDEYAKKDSRLHVIHQENKGVSEARNVALDVMTGDAVAFLDSDDALHPDFVRKMLNAMIEEKTDMVMCKYSRYDTEQEMDSQSPQLVRPFIKQGVYTHDNALRALAYDDINHAVTNKLYNSKLWKDIRFPVGRLYEDVGTFYRVLDKCNSVCVIDDPLYLYRVRKGSTTNTISLEGVEGWLYCTLNFKSYMVSNIPKVFSQEQYYKYRIVQLKRMIINYALVSRIFDKNKSKTLERLKEQIEIGIDDVGLENCSKSLIICYKTICHFPQIITFCYPIYCAIHQLERDLVASWKKIRSSKRI